MIFETISEFKAAVADGARLLGLDVGTASIGVALSDSGQMIATPHSKLDRQNINKDTGKLRTIMKEHAVGGIVVGLPMTMDGQEGESCEIVRGFAARLQKKIDVPMFFQDERMSTAAVQRTLKETDMTRKKRESIDDKMAASYILQSTLDALRHAK